MPTLKGSRITSLEDLMTRSPMRTRVALWTAAGVLGTGLAAGGVAQAVSSPSPGADKVAAGAKAGHAKAHGKGQRLERMAGNVLHGDVVVRIKDGYRTVALQRGSVVSVSTTALQLRSVDGFTATYAVNGDTWIRKGHKGGQSSSLATGDQVTVVATRSGDTLTATKVLAHPEKPEKPEKPAATGK